LSFSYVCRIGGGSLIRKKKLRKRQKGRGDRSSLQTLKPKEGGNGKRQVFAVRDHPAIIEFGKGKNRVTKNWWCRGKRQSGELP